MAKVITVPTKHLSEYKGKKILVLNPEDHYRTQFGKKKAEMILKHMDLIKAFVNGTD